MSIAIDPCKPLQARIAYIKRCALKYAPLVGTLFIALSFSCPSTAQDLKRTDDEMQTRQRFPPAKNQSEQEAQLAWDFQRVIAKTLRQQANFALAETLLNSLLADVTTSSGAHSLNLLPFLDDLAQVYGDQHKLRDAERLLRRTLLISKNGGDKFKYLTANALNNLAWNLHLQGKNIEAEPLAAGALNAIDGDAAATSADKARILDTLAKIHEGRGMVRSAETLYRRSLAILEKELESSAVDLAISRGNLAGLLKSENKLDEAEILLVKSLTAMEAALGEQHPGLVFAIAQLGDLYRLRGNCDQATPLFRRVRSVAGISQREISVFYGTDREREFKQNSAVSFGGGAAKLSPWVTQWLAFRAGKPLSEAGGIA